MRLWGRVEHPLQRGLAAADRLFLAVVLVLNVCLLRAWSDAPHDPSDSNWRHMLTRLSDEQLTMIGFISVAWTTSERTLEPLIWTAGGWPEAVGELVTADLGTVSRINLARNQTVQHLAPTDPNQSDQADAKVRADVELSLAFFEKNRQRRNHLVHGLPTISNGNCSEINSLSEAQRNQLVASENEL